MANCFRKFPTKWRSTPNLSISTNRTRFLNLTPVAFHRQQYEYLYQQQHAHEILPQFPVSTIKTYTDDSSLLFYNHLNQLDERHLFLTLSPIDAQELSGFLNSNKNVSIFCSEVLEKELLLLSQQKVKEKEIPVPDPTGRPGEEDLLKIYNVLSATLTKLFIQPMDYSIYTQDVIFENNIRNTRTVGLIPYIKQISFLRLVGHLRFAYVKFEVLKITKHSEDGTVRVRWRVKGISALRVFLNFWSFKLWQYKNMMESEGALWYDGYSTFYVGGDGLVYKHVADKMMPDEEQLVNKKSPLAAKLATLVAGLTLRPNIEMMDGIYFTSDDTCHKVAKHN